MEPWKDKVLLKVQMDASMKVSTKMARRKGRVPWIGPMRKIIRDFINT